MIFPAQEDSSLLVEGLFLALDSPGTPELQRLGTACAGNNTTMSDNPNITISAHSSGLHVALCGNLDQFSIPAILSKIAPLADKKISGTMFVDLQAVDKMDDYGALVVMKLNGIASELKIPLVFENVPKSVQELLDFLRVVEEPPQCAAQRKAPDFFTSFGIKTLFVAGQAREHVQFVGETTVGLFSLLANPKRLRMGDTITYMKRVGVDALPIVGLISFLLGLIMAFMSAVQLQQFGANIYVASLVALSMVRELGPIMTAIIVAGRSGSAFAAEIGTMKVSEEVDALITMGFQPTMFLVVPKIIASILVVPLLALYSNLFAIAGGLLIGVSTLDLTVNSYMLQTMNTLTIFDITWGLFKSAIFAVLIAVIGCFKGYQVRGGADSVGRATTSAVVTSIFLIVLIDSILAVILRYWRP